MFCVLLEAFSAKTPSEHSSELTMKKGILAVLVATLVVVSACSTDEGAPILYGENVAAFYGIDAQTCPAPLTVETTEELRSLLEGMVWGEENVALLPSQASISTEVTVSGRLELSITELTIPTLQSCEVGCREPRFEGEDLAGVSFITEPGGEGATTLVLENTTVRFQPVFVRSMANPGYSVRVLGPCSESCAEPTQSLCPTDHLCYERGAEYCVRCAKWEPQVCVCHGLEGILEDGVSCRFATSIDTWAAQACSAGVCDGQ